jgi:hypothetical protein
MHREQPMPLIRAILSAATTSGMLLLGLASPGRADTLTDFRTALAQASERHEDAAAAVATGSQEEAKVAVHQLRQVWQDINVRFTGERPAPLVGDEAFGTMFMQIDMRLIGTLLVIDMGNRDAARNSLAPLADLLAQLRTRTEPAAR